MRSSLLLLTPVYAIATATSAAAQMAVSSVSPVSNSVSVSTVPVITLTFTAAVDPATVHAQSIKLTGRWSGPVPGLLGVDGTGTTVTFTPTRPLFAAEIATLFVSRNVASTSGSPLTGGFTANYWIESAPSSGNFVLDHVVDYRMPGEGPIRTYGFFAGDVDGDGSPDMSATNEVSFDVRLKLNDGCGSYSPLRVFPMPSGSQPSANEGADFDGDGRIDLAVGNQNAGSTAVFINDGAGGYRPPTVMPIGGSVHGLALLDADSDGHIDIVATNRSSIALQLNNGDGTFAAPTLLEAGDGEWSLQVGDANNDGKPDLFCGLNVGQQVAVLIGDGTGGFRQSTSVPCGGFPWQMALGDLDGDGNLDCVICNQSTASAGILFGDGAGGLLPVVSYPAGIFPISVDVGDVEGDGDLDIVTSNFTSGNATLLLNDGNGVFGAPTSLPAAIAGSCAVLVDYDRDGDTDIIVADELADQGFVYRQQGPNVPAAQPPTCGAALRINSMADRAGYGGRPAHALPVGVPAFIDVSGTPNEFAALFIGTPMRTGQPSPFGLLNLDLQTPLFALFDGYLGQPLGMLDRFGETRLAILVSPTLPPGLRLTMQGVVSSATGFTLTNPEEVVTR